MYLKNLKPILPIIIITAVLNALYVTEGAVLFSWWIFTVSSGGLIRAAFMSCRIVLLIVISSVLTYTTTPTELTDGIESLFSPLKFIGLGEAVHTIAMMITIALRFIPTLTDEADKIMSAQKARGADLDNGGLFKRLKALMPILIPLLISSIRRAYELAEAMDCRCYSGGKGRTRMKKLKATYLDLLASIFLVLVCGVIILLRII
jgi:energy-coupling factor transport system permease protein